MGVDGSCLYAVRVRQFAFWTQQGSKDDATQHQQIAEPNEPSVQALSSTLLAPAALATETPDFSGHAVASLDPHSNFRRFRPRTPFSVR